MGFHLENVSFSYGDKPVIRDLSAELRPGRFYTIVGPNGSGKTTLLDLISGHQRPDAGTIHYKGDPLDRYSRKNLSREMALVPQNYHINFPFTVEEVVMMGRYPHIPRFSPPSAEDLSRVETVMEQTGISRMADRFISELSGGERQRVIFARALAQGTPVLMLDEATANLDIRHIIRLLNLTAESVRTENKTVVAVMQDVNLAAMFSDELVFMKDGAIVAHGPVETVLTSDVIQEVFSVSAKVYFEPYTDARQVAYKRYAS